MNEAWMKSHYVSNNNCKIILLIHLLLILKPHYIIIDLNLSKGLTLHKGTRPKKSQNWATMLVFMMSLMNNTLIKCKPKWCMWATSKLNTYISESFIDNNICIRTSDMLENGFVYLCYVFSKNHCDICLHYVYVYNVNN